jgi:ABC-type multidrug transport system fused ATPase/permease subunit
MKNFVAIRAFISYTSRFKRQFWITAAVFATADVVITLVPWIIGQLTASLASNDGGIAFWTAIVIAASISHDGLWRLGEILYLKLLLAHSYRFDDAVFEAIIAHPYGYFIDKFTGKVSSYATNLGAKYRELLDNFHYEYINLFVGMPIIAVTMFTVNTYTGVLFLVAIVLMFIVGRPLAKSASNAERKDADVHSTIDGYTVDAIANFVSIKAFRNEMREARRLFQERHALIDAAGASYVKSIWFWGVMSLFVRWIIWPATFVLNVYLFTQGQIDLAQMTTFLTVIVLFSSFIWEVIWNISQLNIRVANIEEAYRYLFGERNIFKEPSPKQVEQLPASAFSKSLELRNVSFAYPDKPDTDILNDISLNIKNGEKIGLVGHSGGGKSTLVKLLLGYYPISDGELFVDGVKTDNRALGDLTSYVPQDTAVFHRSIKDNIAYGRQGASDDDIVAAAKHAQAHDFIGKLQNGYDTPVGERGIKLSGGQRQRIAIARALLKDAPLLILDEATSALDSESEQLIQTALWELMEGRTAIVIAHRMSTIQKMDRIVVLHDGRIIEQGTHAELLTKNGTYAELWKHQSGGFIEE